MRKIVKYFITLLIHFGIALSFLEIIYYINHLTYMFRYPWVIALFCYLVITFIFYRVIPKKHVKGVKKTYNKEYKIAFQYFEESYQFFSKYKFFDKYGFVFLINTSDFTYRESALLNQAYIKYAEGNEDESKELYKKVLIINSKNRIAKKAIKIIGTKKH